VRGQLTKLQKGEKAGTTRTDTVLGDFDFDPEEGHSFGIIGEPIDPGASFRLFTTSRVKKVEKTDTGFKFTTETGSVYQLDVLPEAQA
jgi:ABC-type polysaccharide/polyol phosphate transport system ATPase subunit